jgi:non-lysosomal glucosylceramidase
MKISRRNLLLATAASAAKPKPGAEAAGNDASKGEPPHPGRRFRDEALREIAFPLGGIGTGTVALSGFGGLRDWEIFNRPSKGSTLPFTFAALRLSGGGLARPSVHVVERQPLPPFPGGFGSPRSTALGLPHFADAVFTGSYPFAHIQFEDPRLPVDVSLEAFNPMAPLDTENSSLPVAVLLYRVASRAPSQLEGALAFSAMNPVGYAGIGTLSERTAPFFGGNLNEFKRQGVCQGVLMSSNKYQRDSPRYGSLALATGEGDVSYRLAWEHGEWWDDFQKWWDEFLGRGRFGNLAIQPSEEGSTEFATLVSHFPLAPGESRQIAFVLSWHFPNIENYWSGKEHAGELIRNQYGVRWGSAWEPAAYVLANLTSLRDRSLRYRDALYGSTLPEPVIDAVSSQSSILRTTTVMVAENKLVLAFEGCGDNEGCCPMNCTHVYNYEQAMAHLFPDLERSMRETDFLVNMRPDGSMSFRTPVPLQQGGNKVHPAADGQMGCVMKVYREWQLSGDDAWLRRLWPQVKRALEYAWVEWDADRDGVMEGQQHNTYDINFYGPNSMMGSLYLGALAAASRMARHLGDDAAAVRYEALVVGGGEKLDRLLWNGEYYVQKVDDTKQAASKYQYGEGCLSDQLLGQWFAEVAGLGKLLPQAHVRTTLDSIYRYNFRRDFEEFANAQRIYALNDEAGLLLCSWPRDKRPALPFVYSDEVWTGIEYQVAAHLIYEGMVKEGLSIVEAVRARYNGARRNPWDEVECGHHYARAMSSWSLLLALSGFGYSAPDRELRFRPRSAGGAFRCLFCTGSAWGKYSQRSTPGTLEAEVAVEEGGLEVGTLRLPFAGAAAEVTASRPAAAAVEGGELVVRFKPEARIGAGERLTVSAKEAVS